VAPHRQIQAASQESLRNSVRTVEQTQHTAAVAAGLIRGQTEQLKDIYAGASGCAARPWIVSLVRLCTPTSA
jgi:hypothetical protein